MNVKGTVFFFFFLSLLFQSLAIPVWEGGDGVSDRNRLKNHFW